MDTNHLDQAKSSLDAALAELETDPSSTIGHSLMVEANTSALISIAESLASLAKGMTNVIGYDSPTYICVRNFED